MDWGEAFVEMGGKRKKVHLFCMRLRSSGTPFVRAYPGEKLEDFLEGHLKAFEYFGGIPRECWYDNLRSAVIKVLSGPYRVEHDLFSSLRIHYLFDSVFCGVRKGNEKGAVENLVGYVRRNTLVPLKEYPNLETLNEHRPLLVHPGEDEKGREMGGRAPGPEASAGGSLFRLSGNPREGLLAKPRSS